MQLFDVLNIQILYVGAELLLPIRLPSPQKSLTSVFGMRTGVPSSMKHQHTIFEYYIPVFKSGPL